MKKFILFAIIFFVYQISSAQNYKIVDENNKDLSNDTIVVIMNADDISNDDGTYYPIKAYFINGGVTDDSVKLQKKDAHLSNSADISYCCDAGCYSKTTSESDNFIVESDSTSELHLDYLPHGTTDSAWVVYRVYKDALGGSDVELTILYVISTGIENIKQQNTFLAYPNPANQVVKINYNIHESSKISLYNIVGNKVREFDLPLNEKTISIDIANLPAGTYFYTLTNKKATKTKRLIIRH